MLFVPYGTSRVHASSHAVRRSGAGSASRVASTTMSAPTTASSIVSTTRTGLPSASSSRRPKLARDSGRLLVTRISSKWKKWSSMTTFENAVPRAPMWPSTFESRAGELARAESGERARPALGDLGRVDDRARHAGARVVERDERELGRKALPVVLHEVADDLHTGHIERPDGRAQDVEVAGERLVGDVLHAWVEAHLALALRAQSGLDHVEHLVERDGELLDVVPGEEEDLEPAVFVRVRRGVAS